MQGKPHKDGKSQDAEKGAYAEAWAEEHILLYHLYAPESMSVLCEDALLQPSIRPGALAAQSSCEMCR
jgi:hypothetical protein